MTQFGIRLKNLRIKHGYTQEEVANKVGVLKASLSAYELEKQYPSFTTLCALCDLFDVSTDYLLGRNDSKQIMDRHVTKEQMSIVLSLLDEFERLNQQKILE